jgi:hypothetical protein
MMTLWSTIKDNDFLLIITLHSGILHPALTTLCKLRLCWEVSSWGQKKEYWASGLLTNLWFLELFGKWICWTTNLQWLENKKNEEVSWLRSEASLLPLFPLIAWQTCASLNRSCHNQCWWTSKAQWVHVCTCSVHWDCLPNIQTILLDYYNAPGRVGELALV